MGTLSGIGTLVLLLAFVGLIVWAWSPRQKRRWEESARLPFLGDEPPKDPRQGGSRDE
jgi:cytochrome c oxidase cbb3-type subunit IV